MENFAGLSIPRYCFLEEPVIEDNENGGYQLHGFCDASNQALSCVVYLRRIINGRSCVAFVQGKAKVVWVNQTNWVILRKELKAAEMCSKLKKDVSKSLKHLGCSLHFWSNSQGVLKWIINPDIHLLRFVKRRVDRILLVASAHAWSCVNTSINPAGVGTRVESVKRSGNHSLWLNGPDFLLQKGLEPQPSVSTVTVLWAGIGGDPLLNIGSKSLDQLIEISPDFYVLKKRAAYLVAFKQFLVAKAKNKFFVKPNLNALILYKAFMDVVNYVQYNRFGAAVDLIKKDSPDAFDAIWKRLSDRFTSAEEISPISELKSLYNFRFCVDANSMLRIDSRLENAELPLDTRHFLILLSKHALTSLIVLHEHVEAGHGGLSYTLMRMRQQFWIIHGISSVKSILFKCSKSVRRRATHIRQLMADLPACCVTATYKPW